MKNNSEHKREHFACSEDIEQYIFHEDIVITYIKPYTKNVLQGLTRYPYDKTGLIRIMLILSGEMEISVDYIKYYFTQNTLIEITSSVMVNNLETSDNFSCYEISVSRRFIEDSILDKKPIPLSHFLDINYSPGTKLSDADTNAVKGSIYRIIHYLNQENHNYKKELLHNTFYNLILEIGNIFINIDKNRTEPQKLSRKDQIIKQFITMLNEHGKQEHAPSFYSDKLCISTQYLSLILKKRSKKTAGDWIASYLLTQAKIKLRTPETTIQQISDKLNFSDQASFGKFFKKHTGISPKKYKEEYTSSR